MVLRVLALVVLVVAMDVFALVMESAGDFRPGSLQPLREIVLESLEKIPDSHVVEAMDTSLKRIQAAVRSLTKVPRNWAAELGRVTAALMLTRFVLPGCGMTIAFLISPSFLVFAHCTAHLAIPFLFV